MQLRQQLRQGPRLARQLSVCSYFIPPSLVLFVLSNPFDLLLHTFSSHLKVHNIPVLISHS